MIKTLLTVLALLPGVATAVICKSVGDDGAVSYTDVPAGECQNRVTLPDYSRYEPRPIERSTQTQRGGGASGEVVRFVRYESIAITQPESGGVVRSNQGQVTVVIGLEPGLQPGHRVRLNLDGRAVSGRFDGLAIDLNGVDRGTHTLRASVIDTSSDRVLIASSPVTFTLRKRGLTDSNPDAVPAPPPPQPDPGYPADGQPPDYSAPTSPGYAPPETPGYTPPANPGYAPSGAYTPNFNR